MLPTWKQIFNVFQVLIIANSIHFFVAQTLDHQEILCPDTGMAMFLANGHWSNKLIYAQVYCTVSNEHVLRWLCDQCVQIIESAHILVCIEKKRGGRCQGVNMGMIPINSTQRKCDCEDEKPVPEHRYWYL